MTAPTPLSPAPPPSDEQLLQSAAQGDEEALTELHARFAPVLYGLGERMLRDPEEIDACVQDVFLNAWRHAPRFEPSRASVRAWLLSIAHHRFLQQLRGRSGRGWTPEEWRAKQAGRPLPEGSALATLTPEQRELLELAYYQGHSAARLAELTGVPLGSVRLRLRAALDHLRGDIPEYQKLVFTTLIEGETRTP